MKLLSETTETVDADRIVNIGGVDYVIPNTDDVKPVVYATIKDILSQIKEYSYILDTNIESLDELKTEAEKMGVTFIVLNAVGPAGGNPELVFSHDDKDVLKSYIVDVYFRDVDPDTYSDLYSDDVVYVRSQTI